MGYSKTVKEKTKKEIKELGEIYKKGDITKSEYQKEKGRLLKYLR